MARNRTGAHLMARCLAHAGVSRVFSLSGNQILPLYDALFDERIEIVHTRHESAAVHMADAWARLTGTPGVCLVSAGPGHANALGGLAFAETGESPVVLLSGHASLSRSGEGAFQEMAQADLARPLARWSRVAPRAAAIPALLKEAFRAALGGRPGPVHLSLPVDVLGEVVDTDDGPVYGSAAGEYRPPQTAADPAAIGRVVDLLRAASRPLFLAGPLGGRPGVHEPLAALSAHTGIPSIVLDHPRGLADPALARAGEAVPRADVILLLAKRQDYRIGFAGSPPLSADCRLIQIDPWDAEIGRHRPAEIGIVAAPAAAASQLLEAARDHAWSRSAWAAEVEALRAAPLGAAARPEPAYPPGYHMPDHPATSPIHPQRVFDEVDSVLDRVGRGRTCVVIDGGEFGQWARARLRLQPPQHLVAEPSGGIGFSIPFALGAKLARPDALVVAIMGDGACGFYASEIETAARCGLPFLAIVGTDAAWGTERHLQVARYGPERTIATDLLPARYDQVAAGLGGHGEYVERMAELRPALDRALAAMATGRPAVVNVRIQSVPSAAGAPQ